MHVPLKYYFRYTAYAVSLIVKEMHRVVKARKLYVHCTLYPIQDDMKYVFSTATLILVVDSSYSIGGWIHIKFISTFIRNNLWKKMQIRTKDEYPEHSVIIWKYGMNIALEDVLDIEMLAIKYIGIRRLEIKIRRQFETQSEKLQHYILYYFQKQDQLKTITSSIYQFFT